MAALAATYGALDDKVRQAACLQKLYDLDDGNDFDPSRLIELCEAVKDYEGMPYVYQRLLVQAPDDVLYRFKLAEAHVLNGAVSLAIDEFKTAAEISERGHDWDDATAIYKRLVALEPKELQWQRDLGFVLSEDQNWAEAIELYEQLTTSDSENPNTYYNLGRIYAELGEAEDAINYLKRAINIKSSHLEALTYLGAVYQGVGDFEESLIYFKRAINVDEAFQFAYFNLAISLVALAMWQAPWSALNDVLRYCMDARSTMILKTSSIKSP